MTLYADLMLRFPGYRDLEGAAQAFAEDLADIPEAMARKAAFGLLAMNPDRLPNGPAVRRRAIEDADLLAPEWPDALRMLTDAAAGRRKWSDLPGPVQVLDVEDAHADYRQAVEERYRAAAKAHDRRVLAEGGIAELVAAGQWLAAVREEARLRVIARDCQADLGLPIGDRMSAEESLAAMAEWRRVNPGREPLELGSGELVDPDDRWMPAPAVVSRIAELRRLAGTRRNGAA